MRNWLMLLSLLAIICGLISTETFAQSLEQPGPQEGLLCARVNVTDTDCIRSVFICAINGAEGAEWYLFTAGKSNEKLSISEAMSNVSRIEVSPDQRYLAIESSAEGVSSVVVLDLRELLLEKNEKAVFSHSNYLAQVEIGGWQGGQLIINSNTYLTDTASQNTPLQFDELRPFCFEPAIGTIRPLIRN